MASVRNPVKLASGWIDRWKKRGTCPAEDKCLLSRHTNAQYETCLRESPLEMNRRRQLLIDQVLERYSVEGAPPTVDVVDGFDVLMAETFTRQAGLPHNTSVDDLALRASAFRALEELADLDPLRHRRMHFEGLLDFPTFEVECGASAIRDTARFMAMPWNLTFRFRVNEDVKAAGSIGKYLSRPARHWWEHLLPQKRAVAVGKNVKPADDNHQLLFRSWFQHSFHVESEHGYIQPCDLNIVAYVRLDESKFHFSAKSISDPGSCWINLHPFVASALITGEAAFLTAERASVKNTWCYQCDPTGANSEWVWDADSNDAVKEWPKKLVLEVLRAK